jgi:hypothetical protein
LGAHADQVIHIHRDAIDSNGVIEIHKLCDDCLRPDAISTEGEPYPPDVDYIGEVTNWKLHGTEITRARPGMCDAFYNSAETDIGLVRVNSGLPISGI